MSKEIFTILYDESPAHYLRSDIEELCHHSLTVTRQREDALQCRHEINVGVCVPVFRHLCEIYHGKHHGNHYAYHKIGGYQCGEVCLTYCFQLRPRGCGIFFSIVQVCLNKHHCREHSAKRAHGVEALRHVQPSGCCLLSTHGKDIGVAAGFKKRQSAGEDEICKQEHGKHSYCLGWEKQECAQGIQSQAHEHTALIGIFAYEHGSRKSHGEIAAIESQLHKRAFSGAHLKYSRESLNHRIGNVVGKAP